MITDSGWGPNTDFILSRRAFGRMAQTTDAAAALLAHGVVDVEYRRYVRLVHVRNDAQVRLSKYKLL